MQVLDKKQTEDRSILDLELLGFTDFLVVGHYRYKSVKEKLKMHIHVGMLEIIYLEKGYQYYQVADSEYILKGGDLLVIPSNTLHGTSSYPEDIGSLYWVVLKIPERGKSILNLSPDETHYLIRELLELKILHFKGNNRMPTLLAKVYQHFDLQRKIKSKITLTSLILQFLLDVLEASKRSGLNQTISSEMARCVSLIDQNPKVETSLYQLAEKANLSLSRFKHRFKKEVGMPPGEYIVRQKIIFAKKHLKDYPTIQAMAFDLGFSSSNYFASVFKKFTGNTPTEFLGK